MSAAEPYCHASFRFLRKHLGNDHIHLHVKVHTERTIGRSDE